MEVKSIEQTRRNWEGSIAVVPARYVAGVEGAKNVKERMIAGEDLWVEKIQAAAAARARAAGLAEMSEEDWKRAAREKGAARIGQGMAAAKDKYARKMAPVLDELRSIELPPRTSDVMQNVTQRVGTIATRLHERFKKS